MAKKADLKLQGLRKLPDRVMAIHENDGNGGVIFNAILEYGNFLANESGKELCEQAETDLKCGEETNQKHLS